MKDIEFIPHTADIMFKAQGVNLNKVFENSALAMFHVMHDKRVGNELKHTIEVSGRDLESLLYNFLEELLFLLDSENFFLSEIKVKVDEKNLKLSADLFGDNAGKYSIGIDIKAVTYNNMYVRKEKGKWTAQVVLDV